MDDGDALTQKLKETFLCADKTRRYTVWIQWYSETQTTSLDMWNKCKVPAPTLRNYGVSCDYLPTFYLGPNSNLRRNLRVDRCESVSINFVVVQTRVPCNWISSCIKYISSLTTHIERTKLTLSSLLQILGTFVRNVMTRRAKGDIDIILNHCIFTSASTVSADSRPALALSFR